MKFLNMAAIILLAQSAQAAPTQEALIRLQVKSLDANVADTALPSSVANQWVNKMDRALLKQMVGNKALSERLHNHRLRRDLLKTIHYEARRAGLDPDLVLSVIRGESNFRKYAISSAGAMGYMQVMPFWAKIVGKHPSDLFNVRTNLRLGCAILRSYLDKERGNISRALARYNGSIGKKTYPNYIYAAWLN